MSLVLYDSNAAIRAAIQSPPVKPVIMPHSACAFQRATKLAANERKVFRKGPYFALIGLGPTRKLLQLVAKEHAVQEAPSTIPPTGSYPVTIMTLSLFTTFYVPAPQPFSLNATAELPATLLPNEFLL